MMTRWKAQYSSVLNISLVSKKNIAKCFSLKNWTQSRPGWGRGAARCRGGDGSQGGEGLKDT